ncbi:MAG: type II secretion system F family protein [Gemmatimonadaceae bacterium]
MTESFRYRASTATGDLVEGVIQAGSSRDALDELRRKSLVPVSLEGASTQRAATSVARQSRADATATTLRSLATLLSAGTTLDRALGFATSSAGHQELAAGLERTRQRVRDGETLASSLQHEGIVNTFGAAVVRAGEESGTLDAALARIADHAERVRELRGQVRSALLYPALMAVVAGAGVLVLLLFVVPRFTVLLADIGGTLPWSTRALVSLSQLVTNWWWVWLPGMALMFVGARQWLSTPANRVRWHAFRLRAPVTGELERDIAAARYTRALGVLLQSGMGILPAMRLARAVVTNESFGARCEAAVAEVSQGASLASALADVLPPLAWQLIAAGEESGRVDELALRSAEALDSGVQRRLKAAIGLVEPVLIVLFGGVVGFIALALLQAVYSINAGTPL